MRMPFYFFLVINLPVNFNLLLLFPKYLLCLLFLGSCYCQSVEEKSTELQKICHFNETSLKNVPIQVVIDGNNYCDYVQ